MNPNNNNGGVNTVITSQMIINFAVKPRHLFGSPVIDGDIFYSWQGNFIRLGVGEVGQVLTINNNLPSWQSTVLSGLAANLPATGAFVGQMYIATDTPALHVWLGASWKATSLS